LKTVIAKLLPYRFIFGALLLISLLGLYAFQHLSGQEIFDYQNSTDRGLLLYTPLVLGFLVLLTPVFIINPRRRVLSIAALILAVPVAGMSLWFGNGLMVVPGFEWLGIVLANYMFFPVAYAVVMFFGWVAIRFADIAESRGGNWWLNFLLAYCLPVISWAVIALRKPGRPLPL
jgi:hypothetical protein